MGYGNLVKGMCKNPTGINSTNLYYVLSADLFAAFVDLSYRSIMQDDKPPI